MLRVQCSAVHFKHADTLEEEQDHVAMPMIPRNSTRTPINPHYYLPIYTRIPCLHEKNQEQEGADQKKTSKSSIRVGRAFFI